MKMIQHCVYASTGQHDRNINEDSILLYYFLIKVLFAFHSVWILHHFNAVFLLVNNSPIKSNIVAWTAQDQPEHAVRMLAKMKHLQVTPNISTYEQLFSLFGNVNAPYEEGNMLSQVDAAKRIKAIEIDMASYGIQHSALSMNNMVTPGLVLFLLWRVKYNWVFEVSLVKLGLCLGILYYSSLVIKKHLYSELSLTLPAESPWSRRDDERANPLFACGGGSFKP